MIARSDLVTFDERALVVARLMASGKGGKPLRHLDAAADYLDAAGVRALIAQAKQAEHFREQNEYFVGSRQRLFKRMRQLVTASKGVLADRDAARSRAAVLVMAIERAAAVLEDDDPSLPPHPQTAQEILADALEYERSSR